MMSISQKVKKIVKETLNLSMDIPESLSIGEIPEWDSMGNIAIIAAIEEAFKIEIPMEDLFELNSVQSLTNWLQKNL